MNQLIVSFQKGTLIVYHSNKLDYTQKFASYSLQKDRLTEPFYNIITTNKDFKSLTTTVEIVSKLNL